MLRHDSAVPQYTQLPGPVPGLDRPCGRAVSDLPEARERLAVVPGVHGGR